MTTKRKAVARSPKVKITPRAIELFKQMRELEEESRDWWDLHHLLHAELKAYPWEFPCITSPDRRGFQDAKDLWLELDKASRPRPTLVEQDDK